MNPNSTTNPLPDASQFYFDGKWVMPNTSDQQDIINPATETIIGSVAMGNKRDVDNAVAAARRAFPSFAKTSTTERLELLRAINAKLHERLDDLAYAISEEMGCPISLSKAAQATSGPQHFEEIIRLLPHFNFEEKIGTTNVRYEPIGVCALITPWNWPLNQIATKVAPAIAACCTMVLKPSENAPFNAVILAEIMHDVGVPNGVFNLVHGDGANVGAPLCQHPAVDMISFTGSTRAGTAISKAAARDIKRVALELGGKSASIILPCTNLNLAIPANVSSVMTNSGQSCNAATRLLVHNSQYTEVTTLAVKTAESLRIGLPCDSETVVGPVANINQYKKIKRFIELTQQEGATLLTGGTALPPHLQKGFFIQPTIFGDVTEDMTIAREEVFGPVMTIHKYDTEQEAIALSNNSEYGLSGAVWGPDHSHAITIAEQLRTGMVHINGSSLDSAAPFGGYKKSGNGREWGKFGLHEFLEIKSIYGAFSA